MTPPAHTGPVVIGYDGSPAAEHAVREAGALLEGRPALVVAVWKEGLGFETLVPPAATTGLPPAPIDIKAAVEIDQAMAEGAQRVAQKGAQLARESGFERADALAVADDIDTTVAETLVDVARERDAQAITVGAHGHGRLGEVILGSTSRDVIRRATSPVVVAHDGREP